MFNCLHISLVGCLMFVTLPASAVMLPAVVKSTMEVRYQDMSRCMERALGDRWEDRYDIRFKINHWGVSELSAQDVEAAPQSIRLIDFQCRRELGLSGQPRP